MKGYDKNSKIIQHCMSSAYGFDQKGGYRGTLLAYIYIYISIAKKVDLWGGPYIYVYIGG